MRFKYSDRVRLPASTTAIEVEEYITQLVSTIVESDKLYTTIGATYIPQWALLTVLPCVPVQVNVRLYTENAEELAVFAVRRDAYSGGWYCVNSRVMTDMHDAVFKLAHGAQAKRFDSDIARPVIRVVGGHKLPHMDKLSYAIYSRIDACIHSAFADEFINTRFTEVDSVTVTWTGDLNASGTKTYVSIDCFNKHLYQFWTFSATYDPECETWSLDTDELEGLRAFGNQVISRITKEIEVLQ